MVGLADSSSTGAVTASTMNLISQLAGSLAETRGRAEQIEQQFESAIRVGLLRPGDRLPPEQVVAEQLGVSPITLRQSLASLRSRLLIETRRGRTGGSYVRAQILDTEAEINEALAGLSSDMIRDLADHAAAISATAARLAASRTDEDDVRRLREFSRRFVDAASEVEWRTADSRFHIGLGAAAQSPRLTAAMAQLQSDLAPLSWSGIWADYRGEAAARQTEIVDAIERHDENAAESITRKDFDHRAELLLNQHIAVLNAGRRVP
jgi:GntR family transcriptional repressor for pyruvate dehydrogenase complex